jgi:hypothetical protein
MLSSFVDFAGLEGKGQADRTQPAVVAVRLVIVDAGSNRKFVVKIDQL